MWLCDTDLWPAAWNRTRGGSWDELEKVGRGSRREEGGKGEDAKREERRVVRKESGEECREAETDRGREERRRGAITLVWIRFLMYALEEQEKDKTNKSEYRLRVVQIKQRNEHKWIAESGKQ